jgi:tRNA-binding EMAP/Myf-like protein
MDKGDACAKTLTTGVEMRGELSNGMVCAHISQPKARGIDVDVRQTRGREDSDGMMVFATEDSPGDRVNRNA